MKLFGLQIPFTGKPASEEKSGALSIVPVRSQGFFGPILESFGGAWQRNVVVDSRECILAFSAVYTCVSKIAADIAKLRIKLLAQDELGIWTEVRKGPPWLSILRKPNRFQNRIQFFTHWIINLLLFGNVYVLKSRDARGVVQELYILDSNRVVPMVASDGGVYYQLAPDYLSGVEGSITLPASEIIHDRGATLWHPLVGISPLYACGAAATQGNRIQANSAKFFENMSRPSGMLTAPQAINEVTAARIKAEFEKNFSGGNIGRLLVAGDGLKYEALTINAQDAQMIEQLKWTVEDVARAFCMPLWKIGAGPMPAPANSEMAQRAYYSETLQNIIESIEVCLDEGLGLPTQYGTEFDLTTLLRMDTAARYAALTVAVGGGWMSPDEARRAEDMAPTEGGATPYLQQQNFSLAALSKRDQLPNPFVLDKPTTNPTPSDSGQAPVADPATAGKDAAEYRRKMMEGFDLEIAA